MELQQRFDWMQEEHVALTVSAVCNQRAPWSRALALQACHYSHSTRETYYVAGNQWSLATLHVGTSKQNVSWATYRTLRGRRLPTTVLEDGVSS